MRQPMPISILIRILRILFQYGGAEDSSEIQPTVEKLEKLEIPVEVLTHYKDGKHGYGITTLVHADDGRYRRLVQEHL